MLRGVLNRQSLACWEQPETRSKVASCSDHRRPTIYLSSASRLPSELHILIPTDHTPPTMAPSAVRSRFVLLALFAMALFTFLILSGHRSIDGQPSPIQQAKLNTQGGASGAVLTGHAIAPKLGNATAKYG
jgi:hypothetical protein